MKLQLLSALAIAATLAGGACTKASTPSAPASSSTVASASAPASSAMSADLSGLREQMRSACREDMKRLCGSVDKAGRRDCMRQNADKFSQSCKDAREKFRAEKRADKGSGGKPGKAGKGDDDSDAG